MGAWVHHQDCLPQGRKKKTRLRELGNLNWSFNNEPRNYWLNMLGNIRQGLELKNSQKQNSYSADVGRP